MSTRHIYTYDSTDLEDLADFVKVQIMRALVSEGYLSKDDADDWCEVHTVVMRKKSIFRTLLDRWKKAEEKDNTHHWHVVKMVQTEAEEEDYDIKPK